jgi:nucleoporin SEH1
MGEILGSIGEDGRFKLWEEDILETPHSTRRFKCIYNARSETKVPFASLDFKNIHTETYVALITRDGYLTVYEPVDHDNLGGDWTAMMQKYVCATPSRQEETGFRVCFHKEKIPCWTAVEAGLDRKALSLAVAAMNTVKIFRTDRDRKWYVAVEIMGARNIIRDVAWANGSMRGYDVIATASKDGFVRIYDITTSQDRVPSSATEEPSAAELSPVVGPGKTPRNAPSGIGAGLAGASRTGEAYRDDGRNAPGRIRQHAKKVAELNSHGGAVWRVAFSQLGKTSYTRYMIASDILALLPGDLLISTGDDGAVHTWKKALNGQWMEYANIDVASNDP